LQVSEGFKYHLVDIWRGSISGRISIPIFPYLS